MVPYGSISLQDAVEIAGEYLGIDTDKGIHCYFRDHYGEFFSALGGGYRTTFARQAANSWKVKESLWQEFATLFLHRLNPMLVGSLPLPVCLLARASRCERFRDEVAFGNDTLLKQTCYGLRGA